jgi:hypothetical protein
MEFIKYQHIERFLTDEVAGIEIGECYVFPKLDGSNGSVWLSETGISVASRNRVLSIESDNQGFCAWVLENDDIADFFTKYPYLRLYGEWLIPHTLRTYRDNVWNKFYVFDVADEFGLMHYEDYKFFLDEFNIDYIPPMAKITNPTEERLRMFAESNTYFIKDGMGAGEGVVVKNYDYRNKYGRQIWAKIVRGEFKDRHTRNQVRDVKEKESPENLIVTKYITKPFVEKEYSKIRAEMDGWSSKYIPRLLNTVYYCLVKEECWNFVKEHKNPTIDFKRLHQLVIGKIKELLPELF